MSVASHLGIAVREYDKRIRTFIPNYAEMLDEAASVLDPAAQTIIDLGVGTGALSARCLRHAPAARVIGVDADTTMLPLARRRLGRRATLTAGNFLRIELPPADAVVATLALHHVRTRAAKARLYARIRLALRRGGVLLSGDYHPSENRTRSLAQREHWLQHLQATYTRSKAEKLLRDWSHEDTYVPLRAELGLLEEVGFRSVEVVWRRGGFAVIAATA
jgi:tRNA (cmo5U34)-methyltransferase